MVRMKYNPTLSIIITFFVGIKWIISSSDEYLFLSPSTTTEEIPQTGWRVRNETGWEDDDTLIVSHDTNDLFLPDMDTLYKGGISSVLIRIVFMIIFVLEFSLNITITSSGPAAEKHQKRMGDYRMIITSVRGKPVWKKTDGDYYIFYSGIRFILL